MKRILALGALCLAFAGAAQAQERTAIGGTDTQMTWSALSTLINGVSTKTDAVNSRVDQVVVCAKKGMVYAPGAPGIDGDGCLPPEVPPSVVTSINTLNTATNTLNNNVNNITNSVNSLTNVANSTTSNVNNILACNKVGQVFNGTACSNAVGGGNGSGSGGSCHLTTHTGGCRNGEAAVTGLQNAHFGGGGSPNGTGFDGTGTVTTCIAVVCN